MAGPTEIAGEVYGHLRGAAKAIVEGHGGIFRELAKEHGEVSVLLKRLSSTTEPEVRKEHFPVLRQELLAHAKAEEREFYPILKNHEECQLLVEQALLEHQEMEQKLEAIAELDYADPTWKEQMTELATMVETHVEMEETEIFGKAKDFLSKTDNEQILEQYEAAYRAEKTSYAPDLQ